MRSSGHLSQAQLASLVDGIDSPGEAFTSFLHLRACRRCRRRLVADFPGDGPELVYEFNLDQHHTPGRAAAAPVRRLLPSEDVGTSASNGWIEHRWTSSSVTICDELQMAGALASQLDRIAPARQQLALEARRFHTMGFAIYLLRRSTRFWNERPSESCRLAQLALTVVAKLDPRAYPLGLAADLRCKALASLGNSHRLTGRLREAEIRLTDALTSLEQGTGELSLRAHVLELLAELHRDQRHFQLGLAKARKARELYEKSGDTRKMAWLSVVEASILGTEGNTQEAIEVLSKVLTSFSRSVLGEAIYWAARQNLCQTLVEADRLWEARRELKDVKRWARETGTTLIVARVLWMEALLSGREGDSTRAALRLERVRDVFLGHGLPYDAALACLDLASLYLDKGQLAEAGELARMLAPIFQATGIHREALASISVVASALEKKSATTVQVEVLQRHLTRQRRRETVD